MRHYSNISDKRETQPAAFRLPNRLIEDFKETCLEKGWTNHTTVFSLVVDQFLHQTKSKRKLPKKAFDFEKEELGSYSSRFDAVLISAVKARADQYEVTATDIVRRALEIFVES